VNEDRPFAENAPWGAREGLPPLDIEGQRTVERLLTLRQNLIERHGVATRRGEGTEAARLVGVIGRLDEAIEAAGQEPDAARAREQADAALAALRDEATGA